MRLQVFDIYIRNLWKILLWSVLLIRKFLGKKSCIFYEILILIVNISAFPKISTLSFENIAIDKIAVIWFQKYIYVAKYRDSYWYDIVSIRIWHIKHLFVDEIDENEIGENDETDEKGETARKVKAKMDLEVVIGYYWKIVWLSS